jgi:2-polyprenyl-6-methoxyphenol hydroxylase-like FAD-dependent oxidoreductase
VDRGDYWQCAYLVRKGGDQGLRAEPVDRLRDRLAVLPPWLGDRTSTAPGNWADVRLLVVSLNRLRRWYGDCLLLIGDAAHAMSPVGGVGSTSPCRTPSRPPGSWVARYGRAGRSAAPSCAGSSCGAGGRRA